MSLEQSPQSIEVVPLTLDTIAAWLEENGAVEEYPAHETEVDPATAEAWSRDVKELIGNAMQYKNQVRQDPTLSVSQNHFRYRTAESGTVPSTEEFAVYKNDSSAVPNVVRRYSKNIADEPTWTVQADLIERVDSEPTKINARNSCTLVQKATTETEERELGTTRTPLTQQEAAIVVADVLSRLREKLDSVVK